MLILELLKGFKPKKYKEVKRLQTPGKVKTAGVLSLQDIHFGKEGNETIDLDFEETIKDLIDRASGSHHLEKIYYVVGGDLINMDTEKAKIKTPIITRWFSLKLKLLVSNRLV